MWFLKTMKMLFQCYISPKNSVLWHIKAQKPVGEFTLWYNVFCIAPCTAAKLDFRKVKELKKTKYKNLRRDAIFLFVH